MTLVSADGLTAVRMSASPPTADKAAEMARAYYGTKLGHLRTKDSNIPGIKAFTFTNRPNIFFFFLGCNKWSALVTPFTFTTIG